MNQMTLKNLAMRLALASLFAGSAAGADDQIFKCAGKDGETIFASKPCGPDAEEIVVARPPPPGPVVSGISVDPPSAQTPPASAPISAAQKERIARGEAEQAAATCNVEARMLVTRLGEIDRQDYALGNPYATAEQIEAARANDRKPVVDRLAFVRSECEKRWDTAYQAAKAR